MTKAKDKSTQKRDKLIIIDGNALIHRSFHALPPTIRTKSGEIVNAVYGFASFLLKAIRDIKPEYVVLTMDKKAPTFRHKEYKEYKATRTKAPDELYMQIPRIKELANAFDIPLFEMSGFEADDLIGTIAEKNKKEKNVKNIIVTGDMDTLQLIDDLYTNVYTMSKGLSDSVIYDEKKVIERYKITPKQMIDYKALRGDPSDNIPGVKGIGEKTAVELLNGFGTLDEIYKHITHNSQEINDKFTPRIINLLKEHKKDAYMSKSLATIKCDVPIKFNLEKTRFNTYDIKKVIKLFTELEFKSLLPRLQELNNGGAKLTKEEVLEKASDKFKRNEKDFKYTLIDTETKFKKFFAEINKVKSFTFDTETSDFDTLSAGLLGVSFSWKKGEAYYVKITDDRRQTTDDNLFNYKKTEIQKKEIHPWLAKLKPIFEDENIKKSAHNAKFDLKIIQHQGINIKGINFDTMIASYLLNPGTRQHNLDAVTFTELGFEKISKKDLLGTGKEKISFSEVQTEKLFNYSCEDADFTNRLVKKIKPLLKEKDLVKLFETIEIPLIPILAEMETHGIKLDVNKLKIMNIKVSKNILKLETKIHKLAGSNFNINSTKQLKEILFVRLELPTELVKKTKTGFSTGADELKKLNDYHPIISLISDYRELAKLKSTYIDALPELINKKTGRIHTSFNQTVTATGRLSSTEPNLQNIPVKTKLGREIREAFIAEKGFKLVALDYSQIELRLAAHMSGDKRMIKAFQEGADIHTSTAAKINDVKNEEVTTKMRREAKAINFGVLYGQGPHGLAQTADIPYFTAKEFIDKYFEVYDGVKKYIDKSIETARKLGYAETLFERRRYLPEINSSIIMVRKGAERMAMNTPLQGTAADMLKVAMIKIHDELPSTSSLLNKERDKVRSKMLIQVHDELVFEIKTEEVEKEAKKIKNIMENILKLKVPVIVDVKVGDNWGEMSELKV